LTRSLKSKYLTGENPKMQAPIRAQIVPVQPIEYGEGADLSHEELGSIEIEIRVVLDSRIDRAVRVDRVAKTEHGLGPRVVAGYLHSLHVDGKGFCPGSDLLGRGSGSFGKQVPDSLPSRNPLDQLEGAFPTSKPEGESFQVVLWEDPVFVALVGEGYYSARGCAVEPVAGGEFARFQHGRQIDDLRATPDGADGLQLGCAVTVVDPF
jgi:hypothetical protein